MSNWLQEQKDREFKQLSAEFFSYLRRAMAEGTMRGLTVEQIKEKHKTHFDMLDRLIEISESEDEPGDYMPKLVTTS